MLAYLSWDSKTMNGHDYFKQSAATRINYGMFFFLISENFHLTVFFFIVNSDICWQWEPAQRWRMKVEKNLQTSSTQTAKSWPDCLKCSVCECAPNGPKRKRHQRRQQTERPYRKDIKHIWQYTVQYGTSLLQVESIWPQLNGGSVSWFQRHA